MLSQICFHVTKQFIPAFNNDNDKYLFILQKVDELNLNIKTGDINLCAVDKIFQIVLKIKNVKVPITSKFLFSLLILYFTQSASAKTFLDLDKTRFSVLNF